MECRLVLPCQSLVLLVSVPISVLLPDLLRLRTRVGVGVRVRVRVTLRVTVRVSVRVRVRVRVRRALARPRAAVEQNVEAGGGDHVARELGVRVVREGLDQDADLLEPLEERVEQPRVPQRRMHLRHAQVRVYSEEGEPGAECTLPADVAPWLFGKAL